MKRLFLVFCLFLFTSACDARDTNPLPTQPVADFPTLAPDSLPACGTSDLDGSANSSNDQNSVVMGMTLTNTSKHTCTLANPPRAGLLDLKGASLTLVTTLLSPATAQPTPNPILQLSPGGIVLFSAIWQNYCQPAPDQNLILRLELGQAQNLEDQITLSTAPVCLDKNKPSTLQIGAFSSPP